MFVCLFFLGYPDSFRFFKWLDEVDANVHAAETNCLKMSFNS